MRYVCAKCGRRFRTDEQEPTADLPCPNCAAPLAAFPDGEPTPPGVPAQDLPTARFTPPVSAPPGAAPRRSRRRIALAVAAGCLLAVAAYGAYVALDTTGRTSAPAEPNRSQTPAPRLASPLVEQLEDASNQLRTQSHELDKQLKQLQQENGQLLTKNDELIGRIKELEQQLGKLRGEFDELKKNAITRQSMAEQRRRFFTRFRRNRR